MPVKPKHNPKAPKRLINKAAKAWKTVYKHKLCSGWGVFPDGVKCKGCSDCRAKKKNLKTKK